MQPVARHQHRHFKTLILLVVSMTAGAFLLFWIDHLAPSQRPRTLRGMSAAGGAWSRVAVRTQDSAEDPGFFHFRIDEGGQLYQSKFWTAGYQHPDSEGVIHIVVSMGDPADPMTAAQNGALAQILGRLCRDHHIARDHVQIIPMARMARADESMVSMR